MPIELAKGARFLRITVSACHTIVMKAEMNKKTRGKPVFETTSTYFVRKCWMLPTGVQNTIHISTPLLETSLLKFHDELI